MRLPAVCTQTDANSVTPVLHRTTTHTPTEKIRIAFVVHSFDLGGLERCITRLVNSLDEQAFEPHVVCLSRKGNAACLVRRPDVRVYELAKRPGNDWKIAGQLALLLKREAFHIVHSHNWGTLLETAVARRWADTPVWIHAERGTVLGTLQDTGLRTRLRAFAMKWALKKCNALISNAHSTARRVERLIGYPAKRIQVIPNGVESPDYQELPHLRSEIRKSLRLDSDVILSGSVGRLHEVKGFDILLHAVRRVLERSQQFHLLLVGDGPERPALEHLSSKLGITDHVHFAGYQARVVGWLAAMDIYVNSSHSEAMSQSLVEAISCGLPSVVTQVGDSEQVVGEPNACGIVVPPNDPDALAEALFTLLGSPQLRDVMANRALTRYRQRYTIEKMITAYEGLYRQLLPGTPAAPSLAR